MSEMEDPTRMPAAARPPFWRHPWFWSAVLLVLVLACAAMFLLGGNM